MATNPAQDVRDALDKIDETPFGSVGKLFDRMADDAQRAVNERNHLIEALGGMVLVCGRTGDAFQDFEEQAAAFRSETGQVIGRRFMFDFASERNVPAKAIERDGSAFNLTARRSRVAEFYPSDLGDFHRRPSGVQFFDRGFRALEAEAVIHAFLARRGIATPANKEIFERSVQIPQCLVLTSCCDSSNPIELRPKRRQFSALRCVTDVLAVGAMILPPKVAALFKRKIVNQTANSRELLERMFLFGAGREFVAESPGHGGILS